MGHLLFVYGLVSTEKGNLAKQNKESIPKELSGSILGSTGTAVGGTQYFTDYLDQTSDQKMKIFFLNKSLPCEEACVGPSLGSLGRFRSKVASKSAPAQDKISRWVK